MAGFSKGGGHTLVRKHKRVMHTASGTSPENILASLSLPPWKLCPRCWFHTWWCAGVIEVAISWYGYVKHVIDFLRIISESRLTCTYVSRTNVIESYGQALIKRKSISFWRRYKKVKQCIYVFWMAVLALALKNATDIITNVKHLEMQLIIWNFLLFPTNLKGFSVTWVFSTIFGIACNSRELPSVHLLLVVVYDCITLHGSFLGFRTTDLVRLYPSLSCLEVGFVIRCGRPGSCVRHHHSPSNWFCW